MLIRIVADDSLYPSLISNWSVTTLSMSNKYRTYSATPGFFNLMKTLLAMWHAEEAMHIVHNHINACGTNKYLFVR